MTDAISEDTMTIFAKDNKCAAPRSARANSGAQKGEAPAGLQISWDVTPAQEVAIRMLAAKTDVRELIAAVSGAPFATAIEHSLQE
jgi:hypothetical protein